MRLCLLIPLLLFCFLGPAGLTHAEETVDPVTLKLKVQAYRYYYGKGKPINYQKALALYLQAAERGDAEAQFIVGGMLFKGQGTDPDKKNGFKWLLKAAEQGKVSPESLNIIGAMYLRGAFVPQNFMEAKKWLMKAAKNGNRMAQNDLAYLLYYGLGGKKDYKGALALYEQSGLQGDPMAQANAGLMHASGIGTAQNKAKAYAWYSLAASQGNAVASMNRNQLMLEMNWEELNKAQAISVDLYRQVEKLTGRPPATSPP